MCHDNKWTVGCVLDSTKLGTNEYPQKLMSTSGIFNVYNTLSSINSALDEILLKAPKTKDAVTCLADIEHKWHEIGIALEVIHGKNYYVVINKLLSHL